MDVQAKTGSAKPPGGVLHVLAIGIDNFGKNAGGVHLDYAVKDAHDVASALLNTQKGSPARPVSMPTSSTTYLSNDTCNAYTRSWIGSMRWRRALRGANPAQDMAVILISSHGEMIQGKFYLIPYGFDLCLTER